MLETWVDYSKYQGRQSVASIVRMAAGGVVGAYVGAWHGDLGPNPDCEANLINHRAAGMKIGAYGVLDWRDGRESIRRTMTQVGSMWPHLSFVALDVEVPSVTERAVRDAADEVARLGQRPVLYTGNWFMDFWRIRMGGELRVPRMDAIVASYNGRADLDGLMRPFYRSIVGHQYLGSTAAFGTTVDFNVIDPAWSSAWPPAKGPEEDVVMGTIRDAMARAGDLIEEALAEIRVIAETPPPPPPPIPPAPTHKLYTVVSGDTATSIAIRHGLSFEEFRQLNESNNRTPPSGNWNLIHPGETYLVPA